MSDKVYTEIRPRHPLPPETMRRIAEIINEDFRLRGYTIATWTANITITGHGVDRWYNRYHVFGHTTDIIAGSVDVTWASQSTDRS